MEKSYKPTDWLNYKKQIHLPNKKSNFGKDDKGKNMLWKVSKPCKCCGFCPYGQLVEAYKLRKERSSESCKVFGHDCPVYYLAEPLGE